MPTCSLALTPGGDAAPSPVILLAACVMLGLAVGLAIYMLVGAARGRVAPVTLAIGSAHLRVRRERAAQDSTLFGVAMSLMPVMLPIVRVLPLDSLRVSLSKRYAAAGWPGGLTDDEVLAIAVLIGVVLAVPVFVLFLPVKPLLAPLGLVLLVAGPGFVSASLAARATARQQSISRTMPFVLDLLGLTMRAGASLRIAMEGVAADYEDHPIGVEFAATLTDLNMGLTLRDAYRNLARRAPMPVVTALVDDLIQSDELGRPLADTLERQSDRVRARRVQEATETAGKAKVLVLIPGMLVLLACLLVLFAPFIVRYYYGGFVSL